MTGRPAHPRSRRDEGSIALEFTLVAPALLLLVALLLAYARVGLFSATLDAGVRDAARSATLSRSADQAQQRALQVISDAVGPGPCADSLVVDPVPAFVAGQAVTISASCRYPVSDLGLPGAPGTLRVTSSFASPLDPNREVS